MARTPVPNPSPSEEAADPSMDEILASIRKILSEEEKSKSTPPDDGVLLLEPSMMVSEAPPPAPLPEPTPAAAPESPPMAEAHQIPAQPQAAPELPHISEPLVAPEAAAAAASSVGALMRTLASERTAAVSRGGVTIEDIVREEVRPLLKEWLDANLPGLVERLVRAEIERVVGRMAG